ncbi:Na+/H+ antiporter NhaC family protein [Candidatus Uabimicrobium sp. HlEnr_7]|uniref:Na+/H+ antiporter NhaC family protein n=1 Tax=Candidatus Uabimicrobium helgolandensis TaxID=3095367 RepID=UPI003555E2EE
MDYGWLSLIPPILAIAIAFATRKIILSLSIGVLSGTLIVQNGSVFSALEDALLIFWKNSELENFSSWEKFQGSWHLFILLFCFVLGAIMHLVDQAGGAKAYGEWALKRITTRAQASLSTMFLGMIIFFDDYFNCLTVGAVMRSVTDKFKISRAKLAYIIDSTTAPVCILAPISSWVIYVVSQFDQAGLGENAFSIFLYTIPFNFYAWLSLLMVFLVCAFDINIGAMKDHEERVAEVAQDGSIQKSHSIYDLLLPLSVLITSIICGMLYTGSSKLFGGTNGIIKSLQSMHAGKAMFWGGFIALGFSIFYFLGRRVFSWREIVAIIIESMRSMFPILFTLVLSWSIGTIISQKLYTGKYLAQFLNSDGLKYMLPVLIFVLGCVTAFATGSSWGTFAIMIPIVIPITREIDSAFLIPTLSASLAGAIYGDHCSPISDTTILSSIGAGCPHMDHVVTQAPYSTLVAIICCVSFLISGCTISWGVAISATISMTAGIVLILGGVLWYKMSLRN